MEFEGNEAERFDAKRAAFEIVCADAITSQPITAVFAVEDGGGMLFNRRRVAKDSKMRERLVARAHEEGASVWMTAYSHEQFNLDPALHSAADPVTMASPGDFVFVEEVDPAAIKRPIDRAIVYRWNRSYPSDVKSTFDFSGFRMVESTDFKGSSHDRITEEVWAREG